MAPLTQSARRAGEEERMAGDGVADHEYLHDAPFHLSVSLETNSNDIASVGPMDATVKGVDGAMSGRARVPKVSARELKAQQTRQRIVDAAHVEFVTAGFHGANMAAIAERAGVSVQMVYFAFGRKGKLFQAVMERAVMGDEQVPPPEQEWWRRLDEQATGPDIVATWITHSGPIFARAAPLAFTGRVGALEDPELAAEGQLGDRLREEGCRLVIDIAAAKTPLREGLDADAASDLLASLFSPALYVEFTIERGWSHERTMAWFADAIPGLLFANRCINPAQPD